MYPLVESLAIKNGVILNLEQHELRYSKSYRALFGHSPSSPLLNDLDLALSPCGYFKLRILYNEKEKQSEISTYQVAALNSLKIVSCNNIDYHLKYTNRTLLNQLYQKKGEQDDILIIKNNTVTDTYAGNILFFDGNDWHTPSTPLLEGTQRALLLKQKKIQITPIKAEDISQFKQFMVINAMRPFSLDIALDIRGIR